MGVGTFKCIKALTLYKKFNIEFIHSNQNILTKFNLFQLKRCFKILLWPKFKKINSILNDEGAEMYSDTECIKLNKSPHINNF